ncbi:MAG: SlyX family protein, partial [Planctomycetales bacterium]|nr:SlyX family protein [Planctomycetales bacterium]
APLRAEMRIAARAPLFLDSEPLPPILLSRPMPRQPPDSAARITELEIALAHQQRLCEQLNEVVSAHTQELMRFARQVVELERKLNQLREQRKEPQFNPVDEKPPHY